jgi:Txe/YoeB family toxin of Txe-Axe toxin-antitoxin module
MESKILEAVSEIREDRKNAYGKPENNFRNIADYWSTYLLSEKAIEVQIDAHDVAIMMSLLKIARNHSGLCKEDNYVDGCNYLAIAGDMKHGN